MPREADWSSLGLGGDPTPGDVAKIREVISSQDTLVSLANTIDDGLVEVRDTSEGAFIGATGDALREVIDGDLRNFIETFRDAQETVQKELRTYAGVMEEQQRRADSALSQGKALGEDSEDERDSLRSTAEDAGGILSDAADAAASKIREAARSIASPVNACDEIMKVLFWLAIILILPAIIMGGPVAMFAIALNVAIFIKTAVDFAKGDATALELLLAGLAMIAPSTRGLSLGNLWNGLKGLALKGLTGAKNAFNSFKNFITGRGLLGITVGVLFGLGDFARAASSWTRSMSGLWRNTPFAGIPGFGGKIFATAGGTLHIVAPFRALPMFMIGNIGKLNFIGGLAVHGLKGLGNMAGSLGSGLAGFGKMIWNGLSGWKSLRLFLPVTASEISALGIGKALQVGFINRGLFGQFRLGAVGVGLDGKILGAGSHIHGLAGAGGGTVGGIPPVHIDIGRDLALIRNGDFGAPSVIGKIDAMNAVTPPPMHFNMDMSAIGSADLSLNSLRGVGSAIDMPQVHAPGLNSGAWNAVPTPAPAVNSVTVTTPGGLVVNVPAPAVNGVTAPVGAALDVGNLSGVTVGNVAALRGIGDISMPGPGAQIADIPALGRMDVNMPAAPAPQTLHTPGAGIGEVGSVGGLTPSVAHLQTPTPGVTPGVGNVDMPAAAVVSPGTTPVLGRVDMPAANTVTPTSTPSVGRLDVPNSGTFVSDIPAVRLDTPDVPGIAGIHTPTQAPAHTAPGGLTGLDVPSGGALTPDISTTGRIETPAQTPAGVSDTAVTAVPPPAAIGRVEAPAAAVAAVGAPPPVRLGEVPTPTGGNGKSPETEGIAQTWARENQARVDVFRIDGDTPAQLDSRLSDWTHVQRAQNDFDHAVQNFQLHGHRGDGPSSGVPVGDRVKANLDSAAKALDGAKADFRAAHGLDPDDLARKLDDLQTQSLKDRPRLLGGSSGGSGGSGFGAATPPPTHAATPTPAPGAPHAPEGPPTIRVTDEHGASHTVVALDGDVPGGFLRVPEVGDGVRLVDGSGVDVPVRAEVTPQQGNSFHIDVDGRYTVHGPDGAHTFDGVRLTDDAGRPLDEFVHVPPGDRGNPAASVFSADGRPVPDVTVNRHGDGFTVTDARGDIRVFDDAGEFQFRAIRLTDQHGTLTDDYLGVMPNGDLHALDAGLGRINHLPVTRHGDTFHITDARGDIRAFDTTGTLEFNAIRLTDTDGTLVNQHIRVFANGGYDVRGPGLAPANGLDVTRHGDDFIVTDARGDFRAFDDAGEFQFRAIRLVDGDGTPGDLYIRVPRHGGRDVIDNNLVVADHLTVPPQPGRDMHVVTARGDFLAFDAAGDAQFRGVRLANADGTFSPEYLRTFPDGRQDIIGADLAAVDNFTHTRHGDANLVTDTRGDIRAFDDAGALDFNAVRLTDPGGGLNTQYLRTFPDGRPAEVAGQDLARIDNLAVTPQGGAFRVDTPLGGLHTGEFKIFRADGSLESMRINSVNKGVVRPNTHFDVTFNADSTKGTWTKVHTGGTPAPAPGAPANWFDFGTVGDKGLGNGRIQLVSHSGKEVFERRPLPEGGFLDAHRPVGKGTFARFGFSGSQRTDWNEILPDGSPGRHGHRHFGESGTSWFDMDGATRVRHWKQNPDGGHVLADLDNNVLTQGFGKTTWHRFDSEYNHMAQGDRAWSPGRGWTDTMVNPRTGANDLVHEKFGRFHLPNDNRRYIQFEMNADGTLKRDWISHSPAGKENGAGKLLEDGSFLESIRRWEQRPPTWVRDRLSAIGDHTFDNATWLRNDNLLQVHSWKQTPPGGGDPTTGIRLVSLDKATLDIASDGTIVRSVRTLPSGGTLTVGDVALPGVAARPGYLPWSEGADGLKGHRTIDADDLRNTAGAGDRTRLVWQDRFTTQPRGGTDWYTPHATNPDGTPVQWHVAREGFSDGTVIEYHRPPNVGGANNELADATFAFRRDIDSTSGNWTRYDHHGSVVGQGDHWPSAPGAHFDTEISATGGFGAGKWEWQGGGATGPRTRPDGTPGKHWDDISFQDFDGNGNLLRDRRLLGDGTRVDAYRVTDGNGGTTWHWNKIDRHGNVMDFGNGPGDRVRAWIDKSGNRLDDWADGARWSDEVTSENRVIQDIPPPRSSGSTVDDWLRDPPTRVREYQGSPTDAFTPGVWKEFDQGIEFRTRADLGDGTFLESEKLSTQWRRYGGPDGQTMISERTIAGFVWERDTFGRVSLTGQESPPNLRLVGREEDFHGWLNEFRGTSRMLREPNRFEFGGTVAGESLYKPFVYKSGTQMLVEFAQEFTLDFTVNLMVNALVAHLQGREFTWLDVAKAAFGAGVASTVKIGFTAGQNMAGRGGPRVELGGVDQGLPRGRPPGSNDTWSSEWAGIEKVTRWRGGTFDFTLGIGSGMTSGFAIGAANSAIFGVYDKDGNLVKLSGLDALKAGAIGAASGLVGGLTLGAARTALVANTGGRLIHRQGFADIFLLGGIAKFGEKMFGYQVLTPELRSVNPPDWQTPPQPDISAEPTP